MIYKNLTQQFWRYDNNMITDTAASSTDGYTLTYNLGTTGGAILKVQVWQIQD